MWFDRSHYLQDLRSPRWSRRSSAARFLGIHWPDAEVAAALQPLLRDPVAHVRESAAEALRTIVDPRVIPDLCRLLLDPVFRVRRAAVRALAVFEDPELTPVFRRLLEDPEWSIRNLALNWLRAYGSADAIGPLCELIALPLGSRARDREQLELALWVLASIVLRGHGAGAAVVAAAIQSRWQDDPANRRVYGLTLRLLEGVLPLAYPLPVHEPVATVESLPIAAASNIGAGTAPIPSGVQALSRPHPASAVSVEMPGDADPIR